MKKAGLQLWTVRQAIEQDFEGPVRKVAAMGYTGVETAFPRFVAFVIGAYIPRGASMRKQRT